MVAVFLPPPPFQHFFSSHPPLLLTNLFALPTLPNRRVRAEVRRKATRALQDSEGSIEGTVARSDLLWLEKTAKADDFPRAATRVILCSAFTSAGTVFVGSLGTYIWPGIGTDVGDVLGSLAGSLL